MKAKSRGASAKAKIAKTRKRKTDDPAQYERFREFARKVEADDNPEAFDRQFRRIVPPRDVGTK
jgi:hypothetical protein